MPVPFIKEGKVVAYGSLESDNADAVFQVFKKKTGIEVDYWRASATKVMDRALSEYRAGKPLFDMIITNDAPMQIMLKEGIFAKYDSPSAKAFAKDSKIAKLCDSLAPIGLPKTHLALFYCEHGPFFVRRAVFGERSPCCFSVPASSRAST